ncbi:MAG TPA: histidine kinase [Terriglobia bacterium]|nr:histidine kinase [Terriglobia bacterium]
MKILQGRPFDPAEVGRVENVLAAGRAILAVAAALAAYTAPVGEGRFASMGYAWPISYVLFSLAILFLRPSGGLRGALPVVIQAVDIAWITALDQMGGSASPYLALFTFVLVTAAYRWGFWKTIANGVAITLVELSLVHPGNFSLSDGAVFFAIASYLLGMSAVLGYLFENERRLHHENALIARAVSKAKSEFGLTSSVVGVLGEIRSFYKADLVLAAAEESSTGITYLIELQEGEPPSGRFVHLEPARRSLFLFPIEGECWHSTCKAGNTHELRFLDAQGRMATRKEMQYPEEVLARFSFRSILGAKVDFGPELNGRVLVLNPRLQRDRQRELVFFLGFVRAVMSPIYNVYLWRRLRERAGAMERARVARDLHDGLIQSLIGLEMRLNTLKNQAATGQMARASEIEPLQQVLKHEIRQVREMMSRLREPGVEPSELVNLMSKQVDQFAEETGIAARFVAETQDVALPAEVCREIVQILQEALTNVRKHSGAKELLVRLSSPESGLHLAIIDNGKGFSFKGRMTHAELRSRQQGPRVIKERVQLIHGELEIESVPGHGARLDVRLPKRTYV